MSRVQRFKQILWVITGIGAAAAGARMMFGLGATTNLSDGVPWGLWIGFDVMGGVALAAGGFVITATVYIFKREEFHPIVRPAVLTAFLGYIAVIVGLLFDLGLPWHIWRPMVNWQHHSVLFEVAWCVMLYTTVLALEFSPVPLQEFSRYARVRRFLIRFRLPLVILGIALSTLHQSSLGSLFLIMPYRMHPLWYSPILPVLFFVSAIALGLLMVTMESLITSHLYHRKPETHLLGKLGLAARWVLLVYLALKVGDLAWQGKLPLLFRGDWQTVLFWIELSIAVFAPVALLFISAVRTSKTGQWWIASLGVFGIVLNRIDVGGLAQTRIGAPFYVPAWSEVAVSAGVVSAAALVFLFAIEQLKVWEGESAHNAPSAVKPKLRVAGFKGAVAGLVGSRNNSMLFVLAAGVSLSMISGKNLSNQGVPPVPVHPARGGDTLWIDGNLDGYGAMFTHKSHARGCFRGQSCIDCHDVEPAFADGHRIGESSSDPTCVRCHHMNLPRDKNTACATCHRDMYSHTDAFGHTWHSSASGANLGCFDCHDKGATKTAQTSKTCASCHSDLVPDGSTIEFNHYLAPGYVEAMHQLCIGCHHTKAEIVENPDLARCVTCHPGQRDFVDAADIAIRYRHPIGKRVVLPLLGN